MKSSGDSLVFSQCDWLPLYI